MADFGSLQPWVDATGALVNAGLAVVVLVSGGSKVEPPIEISAFYVRITAILCAVGAGLFWWQGRGLFDTLTLTHVALWSLSVFLILGLAYVFAYAVLCFKCRDDAARYLAGLWLKIPAKQVLKGNKSLPPPYGPLLETPTSRKDYFCNSGKNTSLLYGGGSFFLSTVLMCVLYTAAVFAGSATLTAGAMVLLKPPLEVDTQSGMTAIEMPSDVMFAFDSANLNAQAEPILQRAAVILESRHVREAAIEGYTDSKGNANYNQLLSKRRAAAVYDWLTTKGSVHDIQFSVIGYGAANPRAPNVKPNGSDDPSGRAFNRRVKITFETGN
ncbi:MAG: OmpA family protein [Mesorhizobium sp.]|nr:MAG: OmpA family protein [Mesorhizobium sp.]